MRESTVQANSYSGREFEKPEVIERETLSSSSKNEDVQHNEIVGTAILFAKGQQRLIPIPSSDPLDPLNLPQWRKWMCVASLCLFASIGLSVQAGIGSMIPVFIFEYSGLDPKLLNQLGNMGPVPAPPPGPYGHKSADMSKAFPAFPGKPTSNQISLLSSLPSLFIGLANFISIPLANAIGRRPVMLFSAALSFLMLPWAATSKSLWSHLAARCFQALGTGAVESLVPLILQDMSFIYERNKFMTFLWASGGVMACGLGIACSHIVADLSWRWFYWIMTFPGAFAFVLTFIFVPETKFPRSMEALEGDPSLLPPGKLRPDIDYNMYGRKRWGWTVVKYTEWPKVWMTVVEMVKILLLPNIVWIILLNSVSIGTTLASQMTGGVVLLLPPFSIPQSSIGYITVPLLVASIFAFAISGFGGDWLAAQLTKRNRGVREPEHQLANLILPIIASVVGLVWFGHIGEYPEKYHWMAFFVDNGIISYGFMAINSVASVYAIECYPHLAGSLLVQVTALRNIISFGISFGVYGFIDLQGFIGTFGILSGLMGVVGLGLIPVWIYGKRIRQYFGPKVKFSKEVN